MSKVVQLFGKKALKSKDGLDKLKDQAKTAHPDDKDFIETITSFAEEVKAEDKDQGIKELEALIEKNRRNDERIKKEKAAANKSVLRSYRIKH